VDDVKVEFSTDALIWTEATNVGLNGTGTWSIKGLTGVTDKIYVKLYVDNNGTVDFQPDELKTTNGLVGDLGVNDPSNEYTFFNVTLPTP
jgi:hypothetical protein